MRNDNEVCCVLSCVVLMTAWAAFARPSFVLPETVYAAPGVECNVYFDGIFDTVTPKAHIGVGLFPLASDQDAFAENYGCKQSAAQYRRNIFAFNRRMLDYQLGDALFAWIADLVDRHHIASRESGNPLGQGF